MRKLKIKKISLMSLVKIFAGLNFISGLIIGFIYFILGLIMFFVGKESKAFSIGFAIVSLIGAPIIYTIVGIVAALIIALTFNVLTGIVGPLELEVEEA